jgi:hypothetical protein
VTRREATLQSLDPLGALAGRPLTVLAAVGAIVLAVVLTVAHGAEIDNPPVALLAVVVCAAAGAALVAVTRPSRAPVHRRSALLVVGLGFAANILAALSAWGQNSLVRDDWGPAVLGMLLLALCPYRPPLEICVLALVTAAGVAGITVLESRFFTTDLPPLIFVVIAVVPVLALALAGAAFGRTVLTRLEQWRERAEAASRAHAENQQEGIVRSVQQDRVSILNQDVVPLFTAMLEGGRITAEQAGEAARVSHAIRSVMVQETQRTWLDELVAPARTGTESVVWRSPVRDDARLADGMNFDQRAAVRALISALADRSIAHDVWIDVRPDGSSSVVTLHCATDLPEPAAHAALAPYLAVLRVVFDDLAVEFSAPSLTLRFAYVPD